MHGGGRLKVKTPQGQDCHLSYVYQPYFYHTSLIQILCRTLSLRTQNTKYTTNIIHPSPRTVGTKKRRTKRVDVDECIAHVVDAKNGQHPRRAAGADDHLVLDLGRWHEHPVVVVLPVRCGAVRCGARRKQGERRETGSESEKKTRGQEGTPEETRDQEG